jgi:ribose 5-phosphate isomerase RpiB
MRNETEIAIPSYTHEDSVEAYTVESLDSDFEITVPPENIILAVCAHHKAQEIIENGLDASIITLGGAAESNKKILEKLNDIKNIEIPIVSNTESNSLASNISSLSEYEEPFIIFCQGFTKTRTLIHTNYYLEKNEYEVIDWETYVESTGFSEFEADVLEEVISISGVPNVRKFLEKALLVPLARIDPKHGGVKFLTGVRELAREKNPDKNIFTKGGLD